MALKKKLEYLLENSTSQECKSICESFLGVANNGVSFTDDMESAFIDKIKSIKAKDSILEQFLSQENKPMH